MEKKIVRSLTDVLWYPLRWIKWLFNTFRRGRSLRGRTAALCHCALVFRANLSRHISDDVIRQTENTFKKTSEVVYYLCLWPFILAKRSLSTCSFCSQVRSHNSTLLPGWWVLRNRQMKMISCRMWWDTIRSDKLVINMSLKHHKDTWKGTYHLSAAAVFEWTEFVLLWKVQMGGNWSFPAVASLNLER